jgi:hypothetical protein
MWWWRDDEDCSKMWDQLNTTSGPRANIHEGLKEPQENDSWLLTLGGV